MTRLKPWRRRLFGVSTSNVKFDVRGFSSNDENTRTHLEQIGQYFLQGYHSYLTTPHIEFLKINLKPIDHCFIGFAYEGAAMAVTILDFIQFWKKPQFQLFTDKYGNDHIYMLHVGAGWAIARLPVNPLKAIQRLHPLYKWLALDGYGFHQAYFHTNKYVLEKKKPSNFPNQALAVFYQGLGRCFWFIKGGVPEHIHKLINTFPKDVHAHFWSGIGLAATYAGGVSEDALARLASLSDNYRLHLAQGAAFAAKARQRANNIVDSTRTACTILTGMKAEDLAKTTDDALDTLGDHIYRPDCYETWRSIIRNHINEKMPSYVKI